MGRACDLRYDHHYGANSTQTTFLCCKLKSTTAPNCSNGVFMYENCKMTVFHHILSFWMMMYTPTRSSIANAGLGLYVGNDSRRICKGQTICYYSGHIHNFYSSQRLVDKSFLMLVSDDIIVDPGPLPQIKARYINDPLNEVHASTQYLARVHLQHSQSGDKFAFFFDGFPCKNKKNCAGTPIYCLAIL